MRLEHRESWTLRAAEHGTGGEMARHAGRLGGDGSGVYDAANEVCVDAFHDGRIGFTQILDIVAVVLREHTGSGHDVGSMLVPSGQLTLKLVLDADAWARARGEDLLG